MRESEREGGGAWELSSDGGAQPVEMMGARSGRCQRERVDLAGVEGRGGSKAIKAEEQGVEVGPLSSRTSQPRLPTHTHYMAMTIRRSVCGLLTGGGRSGRPGSRPRPALVAYSATGRRGSRGNRATGVTT
jgi:hypothetical protein